MVSGLADIIFRIKVSVQRAILLDPTATDVGRK